MKSETNVSDNVKTELKQYFQKLIHISYYKDYLKQWMKFLSKNEISFIY